MVVHLCAAFLFIICWFFSAALPEPKYIDVLVHGASFCSSSLHVCSMSRTVPFACRTCAWHQSGQDCSLFLWWRCIASKRGYAAKNRIAHGSRRSFFLF